MAPAAGAAVAGGTVVALVAGVSLLGGAVQSSAASPGTALLSGPLTSGAVPDPALAGWVEKAGALCPLITPAVVAAQIQTESGWNATEVSPAGAEGIAQLMPGTWKSYRADDEATGNVSPFNPADAIMAAGRYDCALADSEAALAARTGTPVLSRVLAAYEAGPDAVAAAGGIPPIPETQDYVVAVEALAATDVQAAPSPFGAAVVAAAEAWLGTPYVWGGGGYAGPTDGGFDCSGLVAYAIYQASRGGVALPHSSELQAAAGQSVDLAGLQPGDVIAFQLEGPGDYDHIVIYAGSGQVIVAPHTGGAVQVQALADFAGDPASVRRFG